ncbi:MAG: hypothetical protein ACO3E1_09525 [Flavobacteriales bacterium]
MKIFKRISIISTIVVIVCLCIGLVGCEVLGGKSEGIIIYDITYPKPHADNSTQAIMPSEMEFQFKDDKYINNLSIAFGYVHIDYVVDNQTRELIEVAKIGKHRYAAKINESTLPSLLKDVPAHSVKLIDGETKEIAGFKCKKAVVSIAGKTPYSFDVYYTNEITLTEPNWCTPFKDIPGTLMEYQIEKFDVIMRFTAKEVKNLAQDAKEFTLPEDVEFKTPQFIDDELKKMQE